METTAKRLMTLPRVPVKQTALPLILLLAAGLRFYRLAGQSLWADEGNSVALARRSLTEIAHRTAFDIHPPLYYWLLKLWTSLFGDSEIGLRALSAGLGVGLVWLTWQLGRRFFGRRAGLMAAFIAAVAPLQIYYAQEARMYTLLAVLSALTVLAATGILQWKTPASGYWAAGYVLAVAAGLYTHYAYPLMLGVVNAGALVYFYQNAPRPTPHSPLRLWLTLQLLPLLAYLPWLPIAWRQLTTWPAEKAAAALPQIFDVIATTLFWGLSWPYGGGPVTLAMLMAVGVVSLIWLARRPAPPLTMLVLWLWLPAGLTAVIFSPAFLKFLLVATPPLAILLGAILAALSRRRAVWSTLAAGGLLLALLGASALSLAHYYFDPAFARDNYRGIVSFIKAVGGPADAVILNAEGQQDVFNYYFDRPPPATLPVYPLPRRRPLDQSATVAELAQLSDSARRVYAVYWASVQADPAGLIEDWLNQHLYKAADQWYGTVRLVSYAVPQADSRFSITPLDVALGPHIRLTGWGLAAPQAAPGDILQAAFVWQTDAPLSDEITVFVQVLDSANHLVGQRDAPPALPAPAWPLNQPLTDRHGVFIEPGTPPGLHRLVAGLYHAQTGQRLPVVGGGDFVDLGTVEIGRPPAVLPPEAYTMQTVLDAPLGDVTLLGYDLYKLGFRSTPDTPLHPGDPLHLTLYWQAGASSVPPGDGLTLEVVTLGGAATGLTLTAPPAGVNYPPARWRPGEIVRAQFDLFLSHLQSGAYRVRITWGDRSVLTPPFTIDD